MKIGFVLDDSLDKTDGVQQYILTLGHLYESEGHSVHYLVGASRRTDIPHIHSLGKNLQVHFNQNRMSTPLPANRKAIRALLETEQFDVLHIQMPFSPLLAGRVVRAASRTTVIVGTFHIIPFSGLERFAAHLLGLWCRMTLRRFDAIYSVSSPAQRFAKQAFKVNSSLLPNPVNVAHYKAGRKIKPYQDGKINIVFLGRLVERKGCGYLLKALEKLHDEHKLDRVRVLICGKGPLEAQLKKYVKQHHLSSVVHFVGYVTEKEKIDYLATADIAVLPSTGGESFGIVLIEAMAAGAATVLAGNNVGYRFVMAGHKEQLLNPVDTNEFSKKLRHFVTNSRARQQSAKWQEEHVKQFDVRVIGSRLLKDYELLIAKKANN
jgi:phosphatidyl-myo-inositol alpha-mannosyltransferase